MKDFPRLIEHAFPLRQASIDAVHEKNVRHGHVSTLHIWPARRPLAACRAALLATLLPDPGDEAGRKRLCERIGGSLVHTRDAQGREKDATRGGVLRWLGAEPAGGGKAATAKRKLIEDQRDGLQALKDEVRAKWGRAPRVHDPFSGGGAIPLEAMRLGCEAHAADLNPVAWFILRCTLEYPQRFAGRAAPLPPFALADEGFMETFLEKAQGRTKGQARSEAATLAGKVEDWQRDRHAQEAFSFDGGEALEADLAWQVRAWGRRVLAGARAELASFYPTFADFQAPAANRRSFEPRPRRLCPLGADGAVDEAALQDEFDAEYLDDPRNPRWIPKPAVAYLWARSVECKGCRRAVPLLKTRWLCRKDRKRILLEVEPADRGHNGGVCFTVRGSVPVLGRTAKQKVAEDKKLGAGTMTRAGATCPACGALHTMADLRAIGRAGRLGRVATAVVVDGPSGKEYRLPEPEELEAAERAEAERERISAEIPFGLPDEPTPKAGAGASRAFSVDGYGLDTWDKLFTPRQLLALGTFVKHTRAATAEAKETLGEEWGEAVGAYLAVNADKTADYSSAVCSWDKSRESIRDTFGRFALPMVWDYAETNILSGTSGSFEVNLNWVGLFISHGLEASAGSPAPETAQRSSIEGKPHRYDVILTDPPYYDAIPYSDLMDFFYVWLRRTTAGLLPGVDDIFESAVSPKWNHDINDGELIDDASRHEGNQAESKRAYEDGMARTFVACHAALEPHGRLVIVFAHKVPDAWETLVTAILRAGFVVDSAWPIATEMANRTRAMNSAALSSSVWLVCKKRDPKARPGWDTAVLKAMKARVEERLRAYWDAGIHGPDLVWAATGPAMESFSAHPVVKRADGGGVMSVEDFLKEVRRMVVDFVVGRVLQGDASGGADAAPGSLDPLTSYYLLHRHDFGLGEAPIGSVILYATACGVSDGDLAGKLDLLKAGKQKAAAEDDDDAAEGDDDEEAASGGGAGGGGSKVKLKDWKQRRSKHLGLAGPAGAAVPLIDRVHRLLHLWAAGDLAAVDADLDEHALRKHELFKRLLQSLIELSDEGSEERAKLESLSNHVGGKGAKRAKTPDLFQPSSS